jgi:hypothetical protein
MKRASLFILLLVGVLSTNSCSDSNDEILKDTKSQQMDKKERILQKIKELGLDPANVVFTDTIKNNSIKINSIDDLDKTYEVIKNIELNNQKNNKEEEFSSKQKFSINNSGGFDFDDRDFWLFQASVPIKNSFMTFHLSFNYSIAFLNIKHDLGVKDFNSHITGFTLGFSYQQEYGYYYSNFGGVRVKFVGVLNYNLIIEDIGTVYRQSITCDGSFLPYKYNSGVGQFFVFRGNAE